MASLKFFIVALVACIVSLFAIVGAQDPISEALDSVMSAPEQMLGGGSSEEGSAGGLGLSSMLNRIPFIG